MKKINKMIFFLFLSSTFGFLGMLFGYNKTGGIKNQWGFFKGESAIPILIGTSLICLLSFYFLIRYRGSNSDVNKEITLICPECEKPENIKVDSTHTPKCSECIVELVPLEGFYDDRRLAQR